MSLIWEMSSNLMIPFLIFLCVLTDRTIGQECSEIVPDAVTQLLNGTIAIFQDKNVWMFDQPNKELVGPCAIEKVFEGMEGPLDAAVTIWEHTTVTEFVGASVYFGSNGQFFTFKNLRPYQVEWGDLIYLPVKGAQDKIGTGDSARDIMPLRMLAAFFAPFDKQVGRSKFVFPGDRVLGFGFELGSEFDMPDLSDLMKVLKPYKVTGIIKEEITAAVTLKANKQILLFSGNKFCTIYTDDKISNQKCTFKEIKEFLDCDNVKQKTDKCGHSAMFDTNADNNTSKAEVGDKPSTGQTSDKNKTVHNTSTAEDNSQSYSDSCFRKELLIYFILISIIVYYI